MARKRPSVQRKVRSAATDSSLSFLVGSRGNLNKRKVESKEASPARGTVSSPSSARQPSSSSGPSRPSSSSASSPPDAANATLSTKAARQQRKKQRRRERWLAARANVVETKGQAHNGRASKRARKSTKTTMDGLGDSGRDQQQTPKASRTKTKHSAMRSLGMGVRVQELSSGNGQLVKDRSRIRVHYVGRLGVPRKGINEQSTFSLGKVFDQSRGKPLCFRLGRGEVIKGWDIGIQGMRAGGRRRILVPPAAAYGDQTLPDIPPQSTLIFDVSLL